jgi:hypothetical protein
MTDIDLTNCELSIEELDTVAAGGFWGDLLHAVEHTVSTVYNDIRHPIATFERSITKFVNNPTITPGLHLSDF